MTTTTTRTTQLVKGFKRVWRDLDYVQRRMLDIRLGMPLEELGARAPAHAPSDELEGLFRRSPDS